MFFNTKMQIEYTCDLFGVFESRCIRQNHVAHANMML